MHKLDYIIFSSVDWTTHWQLHHQLTKSLISTGNRVLFIDNTGIRSVNIHDMKRLGERVHNWRKGVYGFSDVDSNNLTLYSPILLPFPYSKIALFINKAIFNLSLSKWIMASNFNNPVVISFLPTPLVQSAIKNIDPKLLVYYCTNNMADSSISASRVKPYEDYFFKNADIVFTAAHILQENAMKFSKRSFYFPPGIDFNKFEVALKSSSNPKDIENISGKIIGYIGALGRVLDQKLLCALADSCGDCTIVLIGPKYVDVHKLESKKNVVFLGSKVHDKLPYYIKRFSVGIVPYICNDFTEGVYPSKLNEYLAMGIPAVSTNLREVRESKDVYGDAVTITSTVDEFIKAVKTASKDNDISIKEKRIEVAKSNSWESRFTNISKILDENLALLDDSKHIFDWKDRFQGYFVFYRMFKKIFLIFTFAFILFFYTPLFSLLGENLIVRDTPIKSDAIVVFSGDGEVDYQNLSYQRRSLDAINFYNMGYAKDIFLSSGREQTIADVDMIRLFLIDKGIPEKYIHILGRYPNSTYQNVLLVNKKLEDYSINSILFITAPYHSLRSVLTWEKNAPNIAVITPEVVDSPVKKLQWGVELDKMRIIAYEYVAIIHNWIIGRI